MWQAHTQVYTRVHTQSRARRLHSQVYTQCTCSCTRRCIHGVHAATHKAAAHTRHRRCPHLPSPFPSSCPLPSHRASGHSSLCPLHGHPEEKAGPQPRWFQRPLQPPPGGHYGPEAVRVKGCRRGCQGRAWWAGPAQAARVSGVQAEVLWLWGDGGRREASRGTCESARAGEVAVGPGQRCGHQVPTARRSPVGLPPGSSPMTGGIAAAEEAQEVPTGPSPHRPAGTCLLLPVTATETRGFGWTAGPRPHSLRALPREPARNADPQAPPRWAASGALGHSLRSVSLGGLPCAPD